MTQAKLDAIRERNNRFREWDGSAKSQLCDDIAALLDHCDRLSALTPEVVETCLHWRDFYVGVHADYELHESEQSRAAHAVLESLK